MTNTICIDKYVLPYPFIDVYNLFNTVHSDMLMFIFPVEYC